MTPRVAGADILAALVANCFLGMAGADILAALVANCFLGMARSAERTQEGKRRARDLLGGLPAGGLASGLLGAGHDDAGGLGAALDFLKIGAASSSSNGIWLELEDALTFREILLII